MTNLLKSSTNIAIPLLKHKNKDGSTFKQQHKQQKDSPTNLKVNKITPSTNNQNTKNNLQKKSTQQQPNQT